jgi:hypothetical protein
MKANAVTVRNLADELNTYSWQPNEIGFRLQANWLNQARDQVNRMDETLTRLRTIRPATMPWEQKAIDRVTPSMVELTSATESAIEFLNGHEVYPFSSSYVADSSNMYSDASRIARTVGKFQEYAAATREVRELRPQLGITAKAGS